VHDVVLHMGLISPYLFKTEILIHLCHSEISEICLLVIDDEASVACLQNPFLYLIMSQMNPVHTFITHLFTIPCKVILNLKTCKDLC
jgi:hypothetical protein